MTASLLQGPAVTRRRALAIGGALALSGRGGWARAAEGETESHGMSVFGDLAMPADFKAFGYVNPQAPKGGTISMEIAATGGNQNFTTFDTLNIYILRGNGAAGMQLVFDTLMTGTLDEPDVAYGLVARAVRWSADRLTYRFLLRPEARFHDGSPLTAADVAFSLDTLKTKGHPVYRSLLRHLDAAEAPSATEVVVRLNPARSRELHLAVAGLPIFSKAYYTAHDFEQPTLEPPLGSSAYKVGRFEQGRTIAFERVPGYWAKDLPVNIGQGNFDTVRFEYFRERQAGFEAFKSGIFTFRDDASYNIWATGYGFPAVLDGRVRRETPPRRGPSTIQGWYFNTRRKQLSDPRVREAIGLAFDFEWTNRNITFDFFKRTWSYFQNTPMAATGKPGPDELALLEPLRGKVPDAVFGDAVMPPVSDGSGQDRALLSRAFKLLGEAGCKRDGSRLLLPDGSPLTIEFLDFQNFMEPRLGPFIKNLRLLGIDASFRVIDAAQYQQRVQSFDYDIVGRNRGGSATPGEELREEFGSEAARTPGSGNLVGLADPVVDGLVGQALVADSRDRLNTVCRALDRVLRAGHYWVPNWYRPDFWLAYWDMYERPATPPKYDPGVLSTWWVDPAKAARLNLPG